MKEKTRSNKRAGHPILGSTVVLVFVLFTAEFLVAPVAAIAPSFSADSVSSSNSPAPNLIDSTLTSTNPQSGGEFGFAVAASGNIVVVGAGSETVNGLSAAGHVYTFNGETGALITALTSPNAQTGGGFGGSVAASGNILVVGAAGETVNGLSAAGHVYMFNAETGALISTLTSPNAQLRGFFGGSVAARGNILIVGAQGETVNGQVFAGHVYTFDAKTAVLISALTSPNAQLQGFFGLRVAARGDSVVVGSAGETVNGMNAAGHVYTFNAKTGALISTLASPNAQSKEAFGSSVAVSGDILVVGAPGVNGPPTITGHAYTFNMETGALITALTSPNAQTGGGFGWSVAASGNIVVVSAVFETITGRYAAGHAYMFNAETGSLISTLTSPNAQLRGFFGVSVTASGNVVVVGAFGESANGQFDAGNAYTFGRSAAA